MAIESEPQISQPLVDVQNSHDNRNIAIDKVGVRGVRYPIDVREKSGTSQKTVGTFTLTVDLPREFKGTHMSRFLEVLESNTSSISPQSIPEILEKLRVRLNSHTAHLEVQFIIFREKFAPVTGHRGMMGYECGFTASKGVNDSFQLVVKCPVTTLCPCSKEISDYGAHNQRGYVTVRLKTTGHDVVWFEDVIDLVEESASAPLYPVLKRPDEKFVTELAYDNPRFVEDVVREVSLRLDGIKQVTSYEVEVENHESIHDHNAYAFIARPTQSLSIIE